MPKPLSNIAVRRKVFFFFLLFAALPAFGQETYDTTVLLTDSGAVAPVEKLTDENRFDTVGMTEKAPVAQRRVPAAAVSKLYKDEAFWYANANLVREKEKDRSSFLQWLAKNEWFRTLLWFVIVGSFVIILIWFLASSNVFLFRRKPSPVGPEEDGGVATDDIFAIRFEKEIAKAAEAKNYRLAVRLLYLQLLKELSLKNIIDYKQEKTNSDYAFQLAGSAYYRPFFGLTRSFEYVWYGQFAVSESVYDRIRKDFLDFKQQLPS